MKKLFVSPFFIIAALWLLFSFPYFFQGKVPFPSSYQVNFFSPWSAYPEFASPYKNEATPDVIGQIYPWREFTIDTWKQGQIPLWNPYSFSGTYHLANYQSAVFSPLNIGFFILPFIEWWSIVILLQPLLAGIFMLLFVRTLGFSKTSQIMSAVSFMFCGFLTTWMMYGTLGYAILFLPLALYAIEKYILTKKYRYAVLLFLTIPLSFFSGHFQISLYFLIFTLYYLVFRAFQTRVKNVFYLFFSILFGLMVSAIQLFPSIEAYAQSLRSGIFQKTESIPWVYLPTFIAPDFFGNPVTRNAWFGHYAEWNVYIGIVSFFFACYGVSKTYIGKVLIFIIPLVLSILLAFSSPVLDLLVFLKVPVLSTSAASRVVILYAFSAAVLAGFGLSFFLKNIKQKRYKKIIILVALFCSMFATLWGIIFFKLFLEADKIHIALSNMRLPSLIFVSLVILIVFIIFFKKKWIREVFVVLILVLAIFDIARFVLKWQPFEPKQLVFANTGISNFYQTLPIDVGRVVKNSGAEGIMFYNLQGIEGYDAVYIKRYGDFITSLKTGQLENGYRSVVAFPKDSPYATGAANFLGVKYIVHKVTDGRNVWEFPFWKYDPGSLKLVYDDGRYEVLENTNAFPRVFLASNVIVEKDPQRILDLMFNPKTNLLETAVIEKTLPKEMNLGSGSAQIISYTPNEVEIKTDSELDTFLILTDSYTPGWNAYIDGKKEEVYRADFTFRGVAVSRDTHTVIFKYEPESFRYGMYAAIIGIVGICIFGLVLRKRKV